MPRRAIPLRERPFDLLIIAFFVINLLFITYIVDIEQIIITDPYHFTYPFWPPAPAVDAIHWWGSTFDPLLMARPVWWKMTIWIDNLAFGPFYAVAIYAWARGRDWIRLPSLLYSAVMLTNITIILGEEFAGPHAAPHFLIVLLANLMWLLVPLAIIVRLWRSPTPFTVDAKPSATSTLIVMDPT